jgi:ubiquinone/menaquinone biosynthesis C-methylase UbiE
VRAHAALTTGRGRYEIAARGNSRVAGFPARWGRPGAGRPVHQHPGVRCLEVGAGRGSIARRLCEYVGPKGRVTATDLQTDFLSELSLLNLDVLPHDVTTGEFPESSFDLVHVRAVLMHIADRMAVLQRMVSWLAPR